jgi:DNA-directed RNA polymerase subunit RPC12/RpoP
MDLLDGNAIAGELFDVFGAEMTTAAGTCATCHTRRLLGELRVYLRGAPGTVARCANCGSIVLVLVEIRGVTCVDLRGIEHLEQAG